MANQIKILTIFGTRPGAIKMFPVIRELDQHPEQISSQICVNGQHRELLDEVLKLFDIHPDYDLQIMDRDQKPEEVVSLTLKRLRPILQSGLPDWVLVQGDTATAMAAALAAFYMKIKVGHIEAGLRTHDLRAPFPEEAHRRIISSLSDFHFSPTNDARENLIAEGIQAKDILITGNTGIDTLLQTIRNPRLATLNQQKSGQKIENLFPIGESKKTILVTVHRRENQGKPLENICRALKKIAEEDLRILFIVHPNPSIRKPVHELLAGTGNVVLLPPQDYFSFIRLMDQADLILTDSGGIQEEAPALGKPILILRNTTERYAFKEYASIKLVGTHPEVIISEVNQLINDEDQMLKASVPIFPYGDGQAGKRIADYFLGNSPEPFFADPVG